MYRPQGYLVGVDPDARRLQIESDTYYCNHHGGVIEVVPYQQPSRCRVCWGYVCEHPACNKGCTPFEKKLDEYEKAFARHEARVDALRSYGLE